MLFRSTPLLRRGSEEVGIARPKPFSQAKAGLSKSMIALDEQPGSTATQRVWLPSDSRRANYRFAAKNFKVRSFDFFWASLLLSSSPAKPWVALG